MLRSSVTLLLSSCALLIACEDPKPTAEAAERTADKASAAAAPAAATPTPTPPAEAPKPRPKQRVEDCPKDNKVTLDNKAVEEELRRKLQKPTGDITVADLKKLKSFNLSQVNQDQLDVCLFRHLTGLKELFLGPGQLEDLSPIAGATKLESLRASMNQVRDLSPLAKLTKLDRLDLGRTPVSDLTPLAGLTQLTELQLDDTQVEDISPLAALTKLERLSIQRTRVKDVAALKPLKNLKFLYVNGAPVADEPASLAVVRGLGAKVVDQ